MQRVIMTEQSAEDTSTLDLDTMDALRGADDVRKRLVLEMNTGAPSISDLAYAVKVRVKEDYKVVEKVLRKRKGGKPEYSVSSLRDLVGLRIVTLYRLDALDILPVLFERIEAGPQDPDSVFSPKGIEEIIIYSTNPHGDAQDLPGRVEALCQAFGFAGRVEVTPENYTSIHIVVWCRGKYRTGYRDIPVEIQVRTALEDVWGEIDHGLKYKRETEGDGPDGAAAQRLELNQAHLNVMKTLIDGLAQYGDQIKLQMDGDKRIRAKASRRSERPVDRLDNILNLDENAKQIAHKAVTAAQDGIDGANGSGSLRTARRRVAGDLIRAADKVRGLGLPRDHENEVLYVLEMERALLLFDIGNELAGASGNATLVEASRIYSTMADLFPDRVAPLYRLARTLDELGDKPAARSKYQAAVDALPNSDLGKDHWLRSAAPRLLAFAIWEDAVQQLRSAGSHGDEQALASILKAIDLTKEALQAAEGDPGEASKTRNNLVYYLLDYRAYGGQQSDLDERGFDIAKLKDMVARLAENAAENAAHWDTVSKAYGQLGEKGLALDAAKKVIELLNSPQRREPWSTNERIMMRDAQRAVEPDEAAEGQGNGVEPA